MTMMLRAPRAAALLTLLSAMPAMAQTEAAPPPAPATVTRPPAVFDGDWLTLGVGAGLAPSYEGSNDAVVFPFGLIAGSFKGVGIAPRPAGLALDLVPDARDAKLTFALGPSVRVRSNRVDRIVDPVVALLPRRDTAVELGVSGGVSLGRVLNPFDRFSISMDAQWDIAGAHKGAILSPSVSYSTPVSRSTFATLGLSADHMSQKFADSYFTITPVDAVASGLPAFKARDGWKSVGGSLILAHDFSGNLLDGGWGAFAALGYSRLIGDARRSPVTSIRGSAGQFLLGAGISYTF